MGIDPVPGPFDMFRLWYRLPELEGDERDEAIARLEEWLKKHEPRARKNKIKR